MLCLYISITAFEKITKIFYLKNECYEFNLEWNFPSLWFMGLFRIYKIEYLDLYFGFA